VDEGGDGSVRDGLSPGNGYFGKSKKRLGRNLRNIGKVNPRLDDV
jgi:hypothetical protein